MKPAPQTPAADHAEPPAADVTRLRRPELARQAPLRSVGTLLRASESDAAAPGAGPAAAARRRKAAAQSPTEDPVARGVRLGYQVIEEQLLQGQKLAERLGRAAVRMATPGGQRSASASDAGAVRQAAEIDGEALLDRVLHLYRDLGALCVDAVEAVARSPALRGGVARVVAGAAEEGAPAATATAATTKTATEGIALDIECSRRTQVALDWRSGRAGSQPRVHALHALEPGVPPLAGVEFAGEAGARVLRVVVAESQPAGTYSGVVVDAASNEPCGTLSVRIGA